MQAALAEFWVTTLFLFLTIGTICNSCKVSDFGLKTAPTGLDGVSHVHCKCAVNCVFPLVENNNESHKCVLATALLFKIVFELFVWNMSNVYFEGYSLALQSNDACSL